MLDNTDLSIMIDGEEGDTPSEQPFSYCFQPRRICQAFENVGWVPFTRKCLTNSKVCHELGQTNRNEKLEQLAVEYKEAAKAAERKGCNPVFQLEISRARKLEVKATEEEQIQELVKQKAAFKASGIWQNLAECR